MGDLFVEIIDGDYFHADHCKSLDEFVKKHKFGVQTREIIYRTKVSRLSKRLGITREAQINAGISKVKAICELNPDMEYTDPSNGVTEMVGDIMRRLIIQAGNGMSLKDVQARVSEIRGDKENEVVHETIVYTRGQKEEVDKAIEKAMAVAGDTVDAVTGQPKELSRGSAYHIMAIEFNNDPNYATDELSDEPQTFQDDYVTDDNDDYTGDEEVESE